MSPREKQHPRASHAWFAALGIAAALGLHAPTVAAHPGGTASDGCHYCRTNCDSWGEAWNQRHCHGGGGGGGGGSGYSPPPPPRDTTPPRPPEIRKTSLKGDRLRVILVGERGATINIWDRGTHIGSATATGSKQTIDLTLADGRHEIKFVLKDAAGNKSMPAKRSILVDTKAPNKPWITIDPATLDRPETMFTIGGEPGARFTFRIMQDTTQVLGRGRALPASGRVEITAALDDGSYRATAFVEDASGNRSRTTTTRFVVMLPEPDPTSSPVAIEQSQDAEPDETDLAASAGPDDGSDAGAIGGIAMLALGVAAWLYRDRVRSFVNRLRGS